MNFLFLNWFVWLCQGCPFFCGPFSTDSTASTQAQTSATDQGTIASGTQATTARDQSFAVGAGSRYTESGSAQAGRDVNAGNVTATGNSTVNVGLQSGELNSLLGEFTNAQATSSDAQAASSAALAKILQGQQSQIGTLAEQAQTGADQNTTTKFALVAIAALGLIGLILWKR
jgi:hypothetical protein